MKKWDVQKELRIKNQESGIDEVIDLLLHNRGIKTKKEKEEFLHPKLENVTIDSVGIDKKQLQKTLKRIGKAIEKKEQIIVFGDYDVDGICGTAILWETLRDMGANALPYIPHRVDEGYGLSIKGIENLKLKIKNCSLIITVDNGIVANEAVDYANKQGIDVIITDHHVMPVKESVLNAFAIVHTTKLCGTGVAYMLSRVINDNINDHLALVALATVADLVPLKGANRTLLYHGLPVLRQTNRLGVLEICREAAIDQAAIDTYAIGHVIAPRLNAAGRLEYAMDSLRLLCTHNKARAAELAMKLGQINKERQQLTFDSVLHAITRIKNQESGIKNLLFIAHETYQQGVIGLVAGKLVEEFYRPSIVLSIGEKYSKASARSIRGFNIIEFIRSVEEHLVNAGGHPMAAGFTIETAKLEVVQKILEEKARELLPEEILTRTLQIDCELDLSLITKDFYTAVQQLSPFGMGNQEPVFVSRQVEVVDKRIIGRDKKHVKFKFQISNFKFQIDGIGFGLAEKAAEIHNGDSVDIAYAVSENEWNNTKTLQLKLKDLKKEK